jgi:hypothetical protein
MVSWEKVAELVEWQKDTRPAMRARDAYKLLYQGVFGVGHIMGPGAWEYLQREASNLNMAEQPSEPLMEPVSVDGQVVRVNLRPFLRENQPLSKLMEAMRLSNIDGDAAEFLEIWGAFAKLPWSLELGFEREDIEAISRSLNSTNPQPMHHTHEYRDAYHPAYRVVNKRELARVLSL